MGELSGLLSQESGFWVDYGLGYLEHFEASGLEVSKVLRGGKVPNIPKS